MAVKLSYSGVTLPLVTPQLETEWLARVHPRDVFRSFDPWNFAEPGNVTNSLPTPSIPTPPDFKFGVLHWPTGASRPAWFHAVVNRDKLDAIRAAVGDPLTPKPLVMYDGRADTTKTVAASMYMLPAMPLNQLGHTKSDGWMLTLTDQRFFWHWRRGVVTQPASWTDLYSQIGTILGVTITPESVNSAYGVPSAKWVSYYGPTPAILDAVADTVGQRVVVSLSGAVTTVGSATAKAACENYVTAADPAISGGLIATADVRRYVPASVKVLFLDQSTSPTPAAPHVESKTLAGLALSEYSTSTGMTGFNQIVNADTVYTGSNSTEVGNYATRAATDWYYWRLASPDLVWPGIEPYVPTGWEDVTEWTFQKRPEGPFASTRLTRSPWNDFPSGDWFAGQPEPETVTPLVGCGVGCGWVAGMATGWCLSGVVLGSYGECDGIQAANASGFLLRYATGSSKWVSQVWSADASAWVDREFLYHTGSGPLRVWLDSTAGDMPSIAASVNDINLVRDCCGSYTANFSLGNGLAAVCTGTLPDTPCGPNTVQIKISCVCCSLDGWQGPGIYCADQGDGVEVLVLVEADRCDTTLTISSGPYPTVEAAEEVCPPSPPPVVVACCPEPVPAILWLHTSDCPTCTSGPHEMTYNASDPRGAGWWTADIGCGGNTLAVGLLCDGIVNPFVSYHCNATTAAGSGTGCDFTTGEAFVVPSDGVCCNNPFAGTIKDSPTP